MSVVTSDRPPATALLRRVAVAFPSGNTTAVVLDQLVTAEPFRARPTTAPMAASTAAPTATGGPVTDRWWLAVDRERLNRSLIRAVRDRLPDLPEVEQCCFVTPPRNPQATARVEMFGGEFCGNAARSVVWLATQGRDASGLIEVSGVDRPLRFEVAAGSVRLQMPLPTTGVLARRVEEGILVQLDGICHLVITAQMPTGGAGPRVWLEGLLAHDRYGLRAQAAVGVSCYDQQTGLGQFCVWVRDVDTIFDETACGSGTCAIGVAEALRHRQSIRLDVVQPTGETIATLAELGTHSGEVTGSWISGAVKILYEGEVELAWR